MVVLDDFESLLGRRKVNEHQLAELVANKHVLWPRGMNIDNTHCIPLEILAFLCKDGVGLLRLTIKHA